MTDAQIIKELNTLKKQIYEMQAAMNKHFEYCHEESAKDIGVSENAIVDLEIELAKLKTKVGD